MDALTVHLLHWLCGVVLLDCGESLCSGAPEAVLDRQEGGSDRDRHPPGIRPRRGLGRRRR